MNNEEKILAILEQMQMEQQKTNARLDKLEQGQADMKTEMADMKTEIADVKTEMAARFAQVDARFDKVADRFAQVDARFDRLEFQAKELWKDVNTALDKIDEHEKEFHSAG